MRRFVIMGLVVAWLPVTPAQDGAGSARRFPVTRRIMIQRWP